MENRQVALVSVVIPTFNRGPIIGKAIQSVQDQTYKNWELLIVDDGSTDDTEDQIKTYSERDERIKYFTRPKNRMKGANSCRNIGIEKSKGRYIAFLDSDDSWGEKKLYNDLNFMEQRAALKGIYSAALIDNGDVLKPSPTREKYEHENYVDLIFTKDIVIQTSTYIVCCDTKERVKFDETLQRNQDIDYFIRFGDEFGWGFREGLDTTIFWESGVPRTAHVESMVQVYKRFGTRITDPRKKANLLLRSWIKSKRFDQKWCDYYANELAKVSGSAGLKYKVFSLAPSLVYSLWKLFRRDYD